MKPMIKYRGGKTKEIPQIMPCVPRFSGRYIEPFFGGGALFFHLEPRTAIINDINEKLMNFYIGVRDNFAVVKKELDELEFIYRQNRNDFVKLKRLSPDKMVEDKNEKLYYSLRAQFNGLENKTYSDATLYYFINKTAYSGMIRYNANNEFNVPFGRYPNFNSSYVNKSHSILLNNAEVFNNDFESIFKMCDKDDFVFLDPPYDCVFSDYGNQEYKYGFGENEHKRLAEAFFSLPCKALMVIAKTPLTERLYEKNITFEYGKNYAVNIRNRFKSQATHIIVTNYSKEYVEMSRIEMAADFYRVPEIAQVMICEENEKYGEN